MYAPPLPLPPSPHPQSQILFTRQQLDYYQNIDKIKSSAILSQHLFKCKIVECRRNSIIWRQVEPSLNYNWQIYSVKLFKRQSRADKGQGRSFGIKRIQRASNNEWNYSRPELHKGKFSSKFVLCSSSEGYIWIVFELPFFTVFTRTKKQHVYRVIKCIITSLQGK